MRPRGLSYYCLYNALTLIQRCLPFIDIQVKWNESDMGNSEPRRMDEKINIYDSKTDVFCETLIISASAHSPLPDFMAL
jgi:hypothetical protein